MLSSGRFLADDDDDKRRVAFLSFLRKKHAYSHSHLRCIDLVFASRSNMHMMRKWLRFVYTHIGSQTTQTQMTAFVTVYCFPKSTTLALVIKQPKFALFGFKKVPTVTNGRRIGRTLPNIATNWALNKDNKEDYYTIRVARLTSLDESGKINVITSIDDIFIEWRNEYRCMEDIEKCDGQTLVDIFYLPICEDGLHSKTCLWEQSLPLTQCTSYRQHCSDYFIFVLSTGCSDNRREGYYLRDRGRRTGNTNVETERWIAC